MSVRSAAQHSLKEPEYVRYEGTLSLAGVASGGNDRTPQPHPTACSPCGRCAVVWVLLEWSGCLPDDSRIRHRPTSHRTVPAIAGYAAYQTPQLQAGQPLF